MSPQLNNFTVFLGNFDFVIRGIATYVPVSSVLQISDGVSVPMKIRIYLVIFTLM